MDTLIAKYRMLFWTPEPLRTIGEYFTAVLMILGAWAFLWYLTALLTRMIGGGDLMQSVGGFTGVRLIWARSSLLISGVLLLDIGLVWYFDKLSDWTAITPHATLVCGGACFALWIALTLRSELNQNRKKLFAAIPKSAAAMSAAS
jgi:hypothetical protein